jgi:thiamine biosynthesis lipoprotein
MIAGGFRAMGTTVIVRTRRADGLEQTRHLFEQIEQACSRFRPDSELSAINAADTAEVAVSPLMGEVLALAALARGRTGGLVDVGVGRAVADWGYDRTFFEVEDGRVPPDAGTPPTWNVGTGSLVRPPGVRIDLGGIAKGWACDLAVEQGLAAMASAGGDMRSADETTVVEIVDPWSRPAISVALGIGALATSSTTRRRWRMGTRDAHHLIDPRTLSPSDSPVLSASALAGTAVEAEAAAKAVLLLGADGLAWAGRQQWIRGAVAVWSDGSVYATPGLEVAA